MSIDTEKSELLRQFNEINDLAIIRALKDLLNHKEPDRNLYQSDTQLPLSYSPEVIEVNSKKYILNYPLRCLVKQEDNHFTIKNETLDIYAVGSSIEDAEYDFAEEFDNLYKTLNSLNDDQLTSRMTNIKKFINLYVNRIQ